MRKFIAMSPFCVLATSGSDGSVDASPRGGNPGFVSVAGPNLLLMPDRSGNNRIDSFRNIVEGSGFVQLIFFVPGIDETLRVGGTGKLSADPDLLASMVEFGKPPRAVLQHRGARGLFPLRQGADALETVVARGAGRTHGVPEHRPGDPRPDHARRAGKPGRGRGALQDAALSRAGRAGLAALRLELALEPADVLLGVELEADTLDQVELGFEEIDVMFLVLHQALEQVARDIVLDAVAVGRGFLVERARADLGGEIGTR